MYTIEVQNARGKVLARAEGHADARLVYKGKYKDGDRLVFGSDGVRAKVSVHQAVASAIVFLPEKGFTFAVPFGDAMNGYPPQAFAGDAHTAVIGGVEEMEAAAYRSVGLNPFDQRGEAVCFPHAVANIETRGEAQFWARNVIDGHRFNERHGGWPYHSWGIGGREDAWLKVEFGRPVRADSVALTLRADFPHDAWWEHATVECSDGHVLACPLVKTQDAQRFPLGGRTIEWIMVRDLIKANDPSPFPSLTQLEVFGADIL